MDYEVANNLYLGFDTDEEFAKYCHQRMKEKLLKEKAQLIQFREKSDYVYHQETEKRLDEIELELEFM